MDFFWSNVFDYFKDRRFAAVFFCTILCVAGILIAGSVFYESIGPENFQSFLTYSLPVVALAMGAWIWRGIARALARRRDRYKTSPLSRDELSKARSKLRTVKR